MPFGGFKYLANSNFVSIHGNVLEIVVFKCFLGRTLKLFDKSSPKKTCLWYHAFWGFQPCAHFTFGGFHGNWFLKVFGTKLLNYLTDLNQTWYTTFLYMEAYVRKLFPWRHFEKIVFFKGFRSKTQKLSSPNLTCTSWTGAFWGLDFPFPLAGDIEDSVCLYLAGIYHD